MTNRREVHCKWLPKEKHIAYVIYFLYIGTMRLSKQRRQEIFDKYQGKCGYTGTDLLPDWQVDHITPLSHCHYFMINKEAINNSNNLIPAQKIINHYKRSLDLGGFRQRIKTLHLRLARLPVNPTAPKSIKHKKYLLEVAGLFGITPDKPFSGLFYFEKLEKKY